MHPEQIKAAIRMKGTTPSRIAQELDLSRTTVSQVINGTGKSARVAKRIAEVTEIAAEILWPDTYSAASSKSRAVKAIA